MTVVKLKKTRQSQAGRSHATRERLLAAAGRVFAAKGFDGARVDGIAAAAKTNKQRLYHYFGNKDGLFTAVLERAYRGIREAEAQLALDGMPADQAIRRLAEFTWDYYIRHPEFIRLLNSENQLEARHLKAASSTREINSGHLARMRRLVRRGVREGTLRRGLDPFHLSVNISALAYFYLMNRHTLATVFQRDLDAERASTARIAVVQDVLARWIAPPPC